MIENDSDPGEAPPRRVRRRPKPVVLPMQPVPMAYAESVARCPACAEDGAAVVGVIALRLVFRCGVCGVKFHRAPAAPMADLLAR